MLVASAIRGCIEYDGSNPSALRPGPPKACSTCWMISLEPLAAQTWAAVSPWPRYRARASRNSTASRSGYRLSVPATAATASATAATSAGDGG